MAENSKYWKQQSHYEEVINENQENCCVVVHHFHDCSAFGDADFYFLRQTSPRPRPGTSAGSGSTSGTKGIQMGRAAP